MYQVTFAEDSLLKIWSDMVCLSKPYPFTFFKSCLPRISLGPFLNTLSRIFYEFLIFKIFVNITRGYWVITYYFIISTQKYVKGEMYIKEIHFKIKFMIRYISTTSKKHFLLLDIRINTNLQSRCVFRNSNKNKPIL